MPFWCVVETQTFVLLREVCFPVQLILRWFFSSRDLQQQVIAQVDYDFRLTTEHQTFFFCVWAYDGLLTDEDPSQADQPAEQSGWNSPM